MQNWDGCSALSIHQTVELIDSRDNNRYTISKLRDGKCWMIQNLRIINKTISSADSNMESGSFTIPASNIKAFTSGNYDSAAAYDNTGSNVDYGVLYNFYTASAGTGGSSRSSGNVPSDICPKNWKLPTGHSGSSRDSYGLSDYGDLLLSYGGPSWGLPVSSISQFNVTYHGCITPNSYSVGTCGDYFWWASTINSGASMFDLEIDLHYMNHVALYACSDISKDYGAAVRCLQD